MNVRPRDACDMGILRDSRTTGAGGAVRRLRLAAGEPSPNGPNDQPGHRADGVGVLHGKAQPREAYACRRASPIARTGERGSSPGAPNDTFGRYRARGLFVTLPCGRSSDATRRTSVLDQQAFRT